jgi:hypothetical protein
MAAMTMVIPARDTEPHAIWVATEACCRLRAPHPNGYDRLLFTATRAEDEKMEFRLGAHVSGPPVKC